MSWNIASSPALQGPWFNPADNPLVRKAAATVGSDYPTAVTRSVTSPIMALRRNIAHCYTDSVTIMAGVRRCIARRALVTPVLAQGPQARTQPSYGAQANVRADKPNAAILPSRA